MAAVVEEKFRGASGSLSSHNITYLVTGASDDIDALQAVDAAAPATYDGLTKDDFQYTEISWPDKWEVTVTYNKRTKQPPDTSSSEYNFEVSLESQRIYTSLSTVNQYVATGSPIDTFQQIDLDADGVPQGVDIRVPIGSFSVTYYPPVATVSSAYRVALQELVGKVNNATFYGHAAGEVMFVGASGRSRNATDWEINYRFEVRPNRTGLTIGDVTGVAVDGWDVLWVWNERDEEGNKNIQKPFQVNVERVYERADFSVLGI